MSILRCVSGTVVATGAAVLFGLAGCSRHTIDVQPIRVEPIHMTLDVNIRVDRELDQFFDFEEDVTVETATQPELEVAPATQPAQAPSGVEGES